MSSDVKCDVCGGTDFYLEAGQYFCNECQTLTQDLQEHVFEGNLLSQTIKTHKKERKGSSKEQVTSWECYNYILRGLVEELIECGADPKIKPVVKVLWFKYLKELKVIHEDASKPPKLQAYNNTLDAETIYERKLKKRKRKSTENSHLSDLEDETVLNTRKLNKKKKEQAIAEYEEIKAIQASQKTEASQSLSALKSDEIKATKSKLLDYSPEAKKALKAALKKRNFKKLVNDVEDEECLNDINRASFSTQYTRGASILNRNKLYVILYLSLLITKDKLTLSDMMRFINEGFLSYGDVDHLLPDDFDEARLNIHITNHSKFASYSFYAEMGFKMINLLKIKQLIPMPNLINLCERYCGELNLPDQFKDLVIKLMSKTCRTIDIVKSTRKPLPNYEARIFSFIIFTLKLLFGLDDNTELKLSIYAESLNTNGKNMFNIKSWLNFIYYRRIIMAKHHFPTQHHYGDNEFDRSDIYINFLKETHKRVGLEPADLMDYNMLKKLIMEVKEKKDFQLETPELERTCTPVQDFLNNLKNTGVTKNKKYLTEILNLNFKESSLDYLLNDNQYLDSETEINFGGDIKECEIVTLPRRTRNDFAERKKIPCKLVSKQIQEIEKLPPITIKDENDSQNITITTNKAKLNKSLLKEIKKVPKKFKNLKDIYPMHYRPEMQFWAHSISEVEAVESDVFVDYFSSLPCNFRMIVTECAYMSMQNLREFMCEYNYLEFYLSHNYDIITETISCTEFGNTDVNKLSRDAISNW